MIVIPAVLLAATAGVDKRWEHTAVWYGLLFPIGMLFIVGGVILMFVTIYLFTTEGQGTLAPWDPTRKLVVQGPYRYIRNPMISGVLAILVGEALLTGSLVLTGFFVLFLLLKTLYFILDEEPTLEKRFGQAYLEYKANVPRWIPRMTPWNPGKLSVDRERLAVNSEQPAVNSF